MATSRIRPTFDRRDDKDLWQAVLNRDASADGEFLYGVETTGIFCRPICPSRRPIRKNVSFFETAHDALNAGFRACRRCQPDVTAPVNQTTQKVLKACRYMESLIDRIATLDELGVHVGLSPTHLQRVFKRALGISPRQYADALRVERLKRDLREGESIASAMYSAGYSSSSRLYESARAKLGMTPKTYQGKASGEEIHYLTVKSPIGGHLLVAATGTGVCAVRLGNTVRELVGELETEFEGASLKRQSDDKLRVWLASIVEYLGGQGDLLELPFDVRATAFQRQVWDAIRAIPKGSTASYGELAQRIGRPTAARAVASACARNPVALVIPCHRVVPKSGGPGEYRWGKDRKRRLLEIETRR